jgi:hypothetical protein
MPVQVAVGVAQGDAPPGPTALGKPVAAVVLVAALLE